MSRRVTSSSASKSALDKALNGIQDDLNSVFGDGTAKRLSQGALSKIDTWVSTRSIVVDSVIRAGRPDGSPIIPFGRQVEISGPEDCIVSDTFIQYEIYDNAGKRLNHKGGSVEKLYRRFHGLPLPGKGGACLKGDRSFTAPSINEEGRVFQNRILDVVDAGHKACYEVRTRSGATISTSEDHKFFIGTGYAPLHALARGSFVFLHNGTPYRADLDQLEGCAPERPQVYVKHHPVAGVKRAGDYVYRRLARSRAVMEAVLNNLSVDEYLSRLNSGELDGLQFLRSDQHVHHLDENYLNDEPSNLVVLDRAAHTREHALKNHNNLRYTVVQDVVESVKYVGMRQTYDLKMAQPANNFVANGIVVHNSGKSTLCAQVAAETQAQGGLVMVTDTESKIAEYYWQALGVDTERIVHLNASTLENVFDRQHKAIRLAHQHWPDRPVLMIWDSLGGTAGADLFDEDSDESPMEQAQKFGMRQAKIISDGMSLINDVITRTRVCYLYTNHEYQKIGVKWGSSRETRGGGKPKYYATVRLQLTTVGRIKEHDEFSEHEREIGKQIRVKALKNHMSGQLLERDAVVMSGRGFVDSYTVLDVAKRIGAVTGKGWATWTAPSGAVVKFQGWRGFEEKVVPHPEYELLCKQVRDVL